MEVKMNKEDDLNEIVNDAVMKYEYAEDTLNEIVLLVNKHLPKEKVTELICLVHKHEFLSIRQFLKYQKNQWDKNWNQNGKT